MHRQCITLISSLLTLSGLVRKPLDFLKVRTCMYWYIPVCTNWEFLYWPVPSCTGTYWYIPVRTIFPNPVQGYRIPDALKCEESQRTFLAQHEIKVHKTKPRTALTVVDGGTSTAGRWDGDGERSNEDKKRKNHPNEKSFPLICKICTKCIVILVCIRALPLRVDVRSWSSTSANHKCGSTEFQKTCYR